MRRVVFVVSGLVLFSGAVAEAPCQGALANASWGLHGGVGFPVGPSEGLERGYQGTAFAEVPWPHELRALRLEVVYAALPFPAGSVQDSIGQTLGEIDGRVQVRALTLNLIVRKSDRSVVRPYLTAGAGVFRVNYRTEWPLIGVMTSPARTRVGGSVGLGFETSLGRVTFFAEARYLSVLHRAEQEELRLVPGSFGFRVR